MPEHELLNPFSTNTPQIPIGKIVDRRDELKDLRRAVERGDSVLLTGENGVGKTCLLRKLRDALESSGPQVFVSLDVPSLAKGAEHFLPLTVDALHVEAFTRLTGKEPKDRLSALNGRVDVSEHLKKYLRRLKEMYRHIRPASSVYTATRTNEFSAAKLVAGKAGETYTAARSIGPPNANEYLEFADELVAMLKEVANVHQVIVFGDEANHINPQTEIELIKHNVEAFARRSVQFVLTMRRDAYENASAIREAFPRVTHLDPFRSSDEVMELLEEYALCAGCNSRHAAFASDTAAVIHRITRGNPREIQELCERAWDKAVAAGQADAVRLDHVISAMFELYNLTRRA